MSELALSLEALTTIRAHTQAIAFFQQKQIVEIIYEEMEEVWLSLYTQDKKCPILEQMATNVKRRLVQRYTVELIKRVRRTLGFDLITKAVDPDKAFWVADDIVMRLSDNKTESHRGLFNALLTGIFGLSTYVLEFMEQAEPTKEQLYNLLNMYYDIVKHDPELDDIVTLEDVVESLKRYMENKEGMLFSVEVF